MKVLFLIQGWRVAASRYRVLQYLPYLKERGMETEVIPYPGSLTENWSLFKSLPRYDIVFLQRKRLTGLRLWLNPNVEVIPSPIDIERYAAKSYGSREEGVVLGWIGDHGSIHYLEKMRTVFDALATKYPHVRLKIVCDTFFDCDRMEVIKKQWSSDDEVRDLQSFDIGLMPLRPISGGWRSRGLHAGGDQPRPSHRWRKWVVGDGRAGVDRKALDPHRGCGSQEGYGAQGEGEGEKGLLPPGM
jgi:hypothetical protein